MRVVNGNFSIFLCLITFHSAQLVKPNVLGHFPKSVAACGTNTRTGGLIVRGDGFKRGDFPWTVALIYLEADPPLQYCGGTLISANHVVTAAHCIKPKKGEGPFALVQPHQVSALFGAYNLSNPFENERLALSPNEIHVHDEWNNGVERYDADIAMLKFDEGRISFSRYVEPICLWGSSSLPEVMEGFVAGWGQTEVGMIERSKTPRAVKLPMHLNEDCFLNSTNLHKLSSKRTFCAGFQNGTGVCLGDSGNGFFIQVGNNFYLRGIVSSGQTTVFGCDVESYAVYTDVIRFDTWIARFTNNAVMQTQTAVTQTNTAVTQTQSESEMDRKGDNQHPAKFGKMQKVHKRVKPVVNNHVDESEDRTVGYNPLYQPYFQPIYQVD